MTSRSMIVGIDEAGRGPIAGPVVAGAIIYPDVEHLKGLKDSKKMTAKTRDILFDQLCFGAVSIAIGVVSCQEVDHMNIHHASLEAMRRAYLNLGQDATLAQVDGKFIPNLPCEAQAFVKGDDLYPIISAASVVAKVARDRIMGAYAKQYPGYGFKKHKGYPTALHLQALQQLGPCSIHRMSFAPLKTWASGVY